MKQVQYVCKVRMVIMHLGYVFYFGGLGVVFFGFEDLC